MGPETLVPLIIFSSMAIIISLFFMFRYRARRDLQETLRIAIEKGQELTPEIIERLGSPPAAKDRDMRRALVAFAVAAGLAAFSFGVGAQDEEAFGILLSFAAFPLFVGIAYFLMYRFGAK